MKYRKLGNTNIDVSIICLGTMTFGEQNTQEDGFEQMNYALERGVNFFDTAELYAVMPRKETYGKTEEIIGNWIKEKNNRSKIILASKIASKSENDLSWIRKGGKHLGFDKENIKSCFIKKKYSNQIDEKKLLEKFGKTFVNKSRIKALKDAISEGFSVAIFDDGLQDELSAGT